MPSIIRLLLAAAIGAIASFLYSTLTAPDAGLFNPIALAAFIVTAMLAVLVAQWVPDSLSISLPGSGRETGKVKWFNFSKGFGFITRDNGEDIFVHHRNIRGKNRRGLKEGQRVSFVVGQGDKGEQAEDVEVI